ncbi:discoidin domain-containing protein [Gracilibacillus timonensis]|uniref:discoidin domain-containing protein n=1 Tax=Gracilibacillus timonensis TaxID=1816696 RepID=UPI0008241FFE|nr:discoidin domain-containing protein [Gracilibacillus timonensis]
MSNKQSNTNKYTSVWLIFMLILTMFAPVNTVMANTKNTTSDVTTINDSLEEPEMLSASDSFTEIGLIDQITREGSDIFIELASGESIKINFLKTNLFRMHLDPKGEFPEYPTPNSEDHTTTIIAKGADDYTKEYGEIDINLYESDSKYYKISTEDIELSIEKQTSKMNLYDKINDKQLWSESEPLKYDGNKTVQTLETKEKEYFYGGGQQNGFYSHKNESINIAIGGGWDAGAASSPVPFYISTQGYGVMRNTFKPGVYDFSKEATFAHNEQRFDAYYFVDDSIPSIIDEYTELTGQAALMPEYAFYLGHADCFNGTHNGHGDQRTLLDEGLNQLNEYGENDMPLGWFLPNDGYGCGYGGLDNLEKFVDGANEHGVEVGLWTESNLHPDPSLPADSPLRRDLDGEVQAGVRGVKTDVAWVGQGYSMALDATRQAAEGIMKEENSSGARPFVVSLDGWAGTQRYASLWSGDQYGGNWEYIRMHIPTYIGAGLSGNPNVGSDMDGIFGGDEVIQTRDHQWKAFTPIQINMDGWSSVDDKKNPWNYGEPYASINRMYLKLKSRMMPYNYTIAEESTTTSMPMVRGMMLEFPEDSYTYGTQTQYQYMWGPNLLIAPVYNESDHEAGVRNGIYLPDEEQVWIDYFTGDQYQGGGVIDNFEAPLWKTPVFVKNGAIIPMTPDNNSTNQLDGSENRIFDIYPSGTSSFTLYEDDGKSLDYKNGQNTRTKITSEVHDGQVIITVGTAQGKGYDGMVKNRGTEFLVNTRVKPNNIVAQAGGEEIILTEVTSEAEYNNSENVFFYNENPDLNQYATPDSEFEDVEIETSPKLKVKVEKTDITANEVQVIVDGFDNTQGKEVVDPKVPDMPTNLRANEEDITDRQIHLQWDQVDGDNTYDLMIDGVVYRNVFTSPDNEQTPFYIHKDLFHDTAYTYRVRAVNSKGASDWTDEVTFQTKLDRFRNVPENMTAEASSEQSGEGAENAIDGDEGTLWHTDWNDGNQPPHTYEIDMQLAYQLDKFEYLPRPAASNGTILKYDLDVSLDGKTYKNIVTDGTFERNGDVKTVNFDEDVRARYIKLTIKDGVGGFASAHEFRPYKVNNTEGIVVGENIPNGVIDEDDLTFFASYIGVDDTDTAWDQVSKVDINYNGVIDAYDLMYVAGQLGETPLEATGDDIGGALNLKPEKEQLKEGEEFFVEINGETLQDINAFNLELTLNSNKYDVIDILLVDSTEHMLRYSSQRDAGDSEERLMAAFSNKGSQEVLEGTNTLAVVKVRALQDTDFDMSITRSLLINTGFDVIDEIGEVEKPDSEVDKSVLESKIEEAQAIDLEDYTEESVNNLTEALATAEAVLADESATQEVVDKAFTELETAINGLEAAVDKTALEVKVEEAQAIDLEGYTEESVEALTEAITIAETVLADEQATQETIDQAFAELETAINGLKEKADKSALETKVEEAQAIDLQDYTEKSAAALVEALATAETILVDESATQEAVDNVLAELETAINGLQEAINKAALEAKIEEAKELDIERLSEESKNRLADTLTASETVLTDPEATEEEIGEALQELETVIKELREELGEVDKSELEAKIEEVQAIDLEGYTEKSVNNLTEALATAEAVLADESATQETIDKVIVELETAINGLEAAVDKATLETKIEEAQAIDLEDYTEESGTTLTEALAAAETVLVDESATQEVVDKAIAELETAINELEAAVDKAILETKVEEAQAIDLEGYTEESGTTLTEALAAAETVLDDESATQEVVDKAIAELETAINELEAAVDKATLETKIEEAQAIDLEGYTEESGTVLTEALAAAETVLDDESATQEVVDKAVSALAAAVKQLELLDTEEIDKTALQEVVDSHLNKQKSDYTTESWERFIEALDKAVLVLANETVTQEKVDNTESALVSAIEQLQLMETETVNKTALQELVDAQTNKQESNYTIESWKVFDQAMTDAREILAAETADQDAVDTAMSELQAAIKDLQAKDSSNSHETNKGKESEVNEETNVSGSGGNQDSDNDTKNTGASNNKDSDTLPDTATSTFNWIIAGLLFALLGLVIAFYELRRKKAK